MMVHQVKGLRNNNNIDKIGLMLLEYTFEKGLSFNININNNEKKY